VAELLLAEQGVQLVSLRRADGKVLSPDDQTDLQGGDTLVLSGTPEQLARVEERLIR
jgi:CPA2 family monovalent cation:H+ antiporter-2